MKITHYILGYHNPYGEWWYFRYSNLYFRGKYLVALTTEIPKRARKFPSIAEAANKAANIWGGPWQIIARPAHEIIDPKLYAQIQNH